MLYINDSDRPFSKFAPPVAGRSSLRRMITDAYRRPEPYALEPLIDAATLPDEVRDAARETARKLIVALRVKSAAAESKG